MKEAKILKFTEDKSKGYSEIDKDTVKNASKITKQMRVNKKPKEVRKFALAEFQQRHIAKNKGKTRNNMIFEDEYQDPLEDALSIWDIGMTKLTETESDDILFWTPRYAAEVITDYFKFSQEAKFNINPVLLAVYLGTNIETLKKIRSGEKECRWRHILIQAFNFIQGYKITLAEERKIDSSVYKFNAKNFDNMSDTFVRETKQESLSTLDPEQERKYIDAIPDTLDLDDYEDDYDDDYE